jgi:hypothetical protein
MQNADYEDKSEVKTTVDEVRMWQSEIKLALESEKAWRKDAKRVLNIYRSESDSEVRKDTFNILWANTEIKRQSVINTTPIPDCRRRYGDDDVVGREVSEILNRGISYTLDCQSGLTKLIASANDFLLVGRGQLRVRYKGYMTPAEVEESEEADAEEGLEDEAPEETVDYEECQIDHVNWEEFFHGPAKEWDPVPWIGYEHDLTKEEAEKRFGEKAAKLSYTETSSKDATKRNTDNSDVTIFRRTKVYEIWDKAAKKVRWLGKDYVDDYLDVIDDPMEMMNFYPSPRPVYAVEDPNSLIPIIEYCQYETLATELEDITRRLIRLVRACKVRGIYDSRLSEIEKVLDEDDNGLVAATNSSAISELGGMDKAILFLPIEQIIIVVNNLQSQRIAVKAMIDELNGMSDIVRGSTNPNETATAQRIKANFASARLDKQKQAFQMFARDLVRLIADVISKFKRETLTVMTGLSYPTQEEKQAAQIQLQMLQQPPMPGMPPQQSNEQEVQRLQGILAKPSWEDIEQVLRSDITREYRIDIETDSTMAADQQAEQEVLASFMQAVAQFTTMAEGAVQSGFMTREAGKQILISFTRKFRLGKDVEEELEKPLPPPPPDPAAQAAQAEMQMKEKELQMKQAGEQQKMQFEQQKQQMEMQRMQMELQIEKEKAAIEMQKMQAEIQLERERLGIEREKLAMSAQQTTLKGQYDEAKHTRDMEKLREPASVA